MNSGQTTISQRNRFVAALAVCMAVWWLTEALPLSATALLPIAVLPLAEMATIREAAANHANPLIFLFLGGFIIGLAIQRFGLHQRMALHVLLDARTRWPALACVSILRPDFAGRERLFLAGSTRSWTHRCKES